MTTRKLKIQLALVAKALVGARMRRGTISAAESIVSVIFPVEHVFVVIILTVQPSHTEPSDGEERVENE